MTILRCRVAAFLFTFPLLAVSAPDRSASLPSDELRRIDAYLADYYRDVLITKRAVNDVGEHISCVDMLKQPGMRGQRSIQLEPSWQLKALLDAPVGQPPASDICPKGSVEMRLPTREKIIARGGLGAFLGHPGGAGRQKAAPPAAYGIAAPTAGELGQDHAWTSVAQSHINALAAQATFNLWKPAVSSAVADPPFSLTQMWVLGGGFSGGTGALQSVEAGANVYQHIYGEVRNLHFFIFFTPDEYQTGCYNLNCAGFVVTSNALPIGGILGTSTPGGTQVEGTIAFYRDPGTGNWLLLLLDSSRGWLQVGYFPQHLFGNGQLSRSATQVAFGGEVYAPSHVPPVPMGSGVNPRHFAGSLHGNVAYVRGMKWRDMSGTIRDLAPEIVSMIPDFTGCAYGGRFYPYWAPYRSGWGSALFFGGAGFGNGCVRP